MPSALDLIGSNKALQDHWVKRIVAIIIDAIIVLIPLYIIFNVILWAAFWNTGLWWFFGWAGWLIQSFVFLLYFVLLEGTQGATFGKKIMNLRVETADGGKPEMSGLFVRNVSKLFGLVILDWLIGFVMEGDPRQKFLDRIANMVVVRTDEYAYQEEQFKQLAHLPPHPAVPPQPTYQQPPPQQQWGQPPPAQAPQQQPQQWPAPGPQQQPPPQQEVWPGQEQQPPPGSGWPQQTPGEPPKRFCQACGGTLNPRGDGKLVCTRCGAVF
jgi:uncharacterized RDD family membrane protein YckC